MRTLKIKLPEALLARLEALGVVHYADASEFVRRIVTDYCLAIDAASAPVATTAPARSFAPVPSSSGKSTSGYKGVYRSGRRWVVCVVSDKQRKNLGTFDNPEDAARAYDNELIARTGDLNAAVNFPGPGSQLAEASQLYISKLTTGTLTDADWKSWQGLKSDFDPPRDPAPVQMVQDRDEIPEPFYEQPSTDTTEPDEVLPVYAQPVLSSGREPLVTRGTRTIHKRSPRNE